MKIVKNTPAADIREYADNLAKTLVDLLPDKKKVVFPLVCNTFSLTCECKENRYSVYHTCTDPSADIPRIDVRLHAGTSNQARQSLARDLYNWLTISKEVPYPIVD